MRKTDIPTAKTVMTAFPQHVGLQTTLSDAKTLMEEKSIHHLVITREDGGYSLLSERELAHHHAIYGASTNSAGLTVNDVCNDQAVCCDINDPIDKVLEVMADRHLGSVVVLKDAELAGIFTTTDACRHFADFLRERHNKANPPDLIA